MSALPPPLLSILRNARHVVLTTHRNPDGDALGSVLALAHTCDVLGIRADILLPTEAPDFLRWLPGSDSLAVYDAARDADLLAAVDLAVVVDLSSVQRMEPVGSALIARGMPIVCIDHHLEPESFATVLYSDVDAPSTCSMLAGVIEGLGVTPPPAAVATCLYTGILTDTGGFRFPRTDGAVHRMVATLIDAGADPVAIYEQLYNQSTVERQRLMGMALQTLRTEYDGRLCLMPISAERMAEHGAVPADVDGFVHHTLGIAGVRMGILVVELENEVKLSFRSKGATYVRDLAAHFGGGGHGYAAGARVHGIPFDTVVATVTAAAAPYLVD